MRFTKQGGGGGEEAEATKWNAVTKSFLAAVNNYSVSGILGGKYSPFVQVRGEGRSSNCISANFPRSWTFI